MRTRMSRGRMPHAQQISVAPPILGALANYEGIIGAAFTVTPINTGGVAVSWSIAPAAPAGLTFNASTGVLSGTPTTAQTNTTYTITATNAGGSDSESFVMALTEPIAFPGNVPAPQVRISSSAAGMGQYQTIPDIVGTASITTASGAGLPVVGLSNGTMGFYAPRTDSTYAPQINGVASFVNSSTPFSFLFQGFGSLSSPKTILSLSNSSEANTYLDLSNFGSGGSVLQIRELNSVVLNRIHGNDYRDVAEPQWWIVTYDGAGTITFETLEGGSTSNTIGGTWSFDQAFFGARSTGSSTSLSRNGEPVLQELIFWNQQLTTTDITNLKTWLLANQAVPAPTLTCVGDWRILPAGSQFFLPVDDGAGNMTSNAQSTPSVFLPNPLQKVYYVDDRVGITGDGSADSPFLTIAEATSQPDVDAVHVEGAADTGTYVFPNLNSSDRSFTIFSSSAIKPTIDGSGAWPNAESWLCYGMSNLHFINGTPTSTSSHRGTFFAHGIQVDGSQLNASGIALFEDCVVTNANTDGIDHAGGSFKNCVASSAGTADNDNAITHHGSGLCLITGGSYTGGNRTMHNISSGHTLCYNTSFTNTITGGADTGIAVLATNGCKIFIDDGVSLTAATVQAQAGMDALVGGEVSIRAGAGPFSTLAKNSGIISSHAGPILDPIADETATVGIALTVTPTFEGEAATSWSISPAVPAGLTFNTSTGVLSGTPTTAQAATTYTVTVTNDCSSDTETFDITINAGGTAPALAAIPDYDDATGTALTITPNNTGGAATSWTIAPAAPAGLTFNTSTGVLNGTPTTAQAATSYTITATNATGSDSETFDMTFGEAPVLAAIADYDGATGTALTVTPSNTGGAATSWSIAPAAPAGLTFNTSTGVLNGTPTTAQTATTYTITATNAYGSDNEAFDLTFGDAPAVDAIADYVGATGTPLTITPNNTGGSAVSWSISPAAPTGLTFNTSTGVLSGTPTVAQAATTYTITATNTYGSDAEMFDMTFGEVPVLAAIADYDGATGTALTITPNNTGGAATSWTIAPAAPAGLTFNTSTGVLNGTPTTAQGATSYTITSLNAFGNDTATFNMTFGDPPIIAAITDVSVTEGDAVTVTPTLSQGTATSWSIAPAFPGGTGLSFNTSTGAITGTTTASDVTTGTTYTITATHSTYGSDTETFELIVAAAGGGAGSWAVTGQAPCTAGPSQTILNIALPTPVPAATSSIEVVYAVGTVTIPPADWTFDAGGPNFFIQMTPTCNNQPGWTTTGSPPTIGSFFDPPPTTINEIL